MNDVTEEELAKAVSVLNDLHRRTQPFMLTRGVLELGGLDEITRLLRGFDTFNEDNDPHGEHDFGTFEYGGKTLFWKFDYYDQKLEHWGDPLSQDCRRILTVCLSEEY